MRGLTLAPVREVALFGAHCDDIAIGMGGTLWQLCRANPDLRVRALVLTGAGTERETEEQEALRRLCGEAELQLSVGSFRDGRVPADWEAAKAAVAQFARAGSPDVVFCPQLSDAHQDHRALAQWCWQEFRDHLILGYEIVKFEGDLPTPSLHVPLTDAALAAKLDTLAECYPSQLDRTWYDPALFRGLARIRGVHAATAWAEAFVAPKLTWTIEEDV